MSTRPRLVSTLGIYHVIVSGNGKKLVFGDDEDYRKYLAILRKYQQICGFKLLAYCLMSNHVHLLIAPGQIGLDRIFKRIGPSFVNWYNIKYEQVGHLFQAPYKSFPVNDTAYLLIVIRYIHQNPVKAAICSEPGQYKYSSFRNYFDNDLIDANRVLSMVSREYFVSFNHMICDDECMDIEQETPRAWTDERATELMKSILGCRSMADFQAMPKDRRNEVLREMRRAGISMKQASRITGISYVLIRRYIRQADTYL